ncbi:MAG: Ig-like domain-containing protein [Opitutaceae bacterium]
MMEVSSFRRLVVLAASLFFANVSDADEPVLGQGERAEWMRGAWGALWLPERNYNGNIEGVTIDAFLAQIAHLKTIDYVQVALASPNIFSPVHTGPHPIIESLWQGDTDDNGDPINLVVPRAAVDDPLMSWLEALNAAGLKSEIYVNSYNLLARNPDGIPDEYPDLSARWENYCDTNPTVQAFINSHPYLDEGDPERRKYMFCYAEFILKEYSLRYGDLIDAWCFDSADNIMEACGDDAASGLLDDQRIYQAFADACHAGNPNAAISFNNSVGTDAAPLATPTFFDDYTFGHPFGGAGNMVVPEILYTRNFAIVEFIQDHNGLPFVTTDDRDWNDDVVGHFFPKQSTTSWNAGAAPCLTDEQFVEWTAEGCINGGAITWGTPLVRTNLENSPVLELRDYALTQLELVDVHFSEFQYPGVPNWRRAETPLAEVIIEFPYSHTLTDGVDFWDPAGGSITGVTLVDAPAWLSVAESSPGSGDWVLSGMPTETEATEYCFEMTIAIGAVESSRTVDLIVNEPPILATENRTLSGGALWADSGLELTYDNNGETAENRAISYSTQSYQSDGGFKLTVDYTTGNIGNNESNNFSIGLISDDTDLSTYTGLNPFAAETSVYSLGVNLTTNYGGSLRGLTFTDGTSVTSLDQAGTNVQFVRNAPTPIVMEIGPSGDWSYSINGTVEATGVIPGGFDLSKQYHVVVYGQDDNGGTKSIQSMSLELIVNTPPVANNISATVIENSSVGVTLYGSDVDGDSLTYSVLVEPEHGDLSGTAPNLTYTPDPDFIGLDAFTYTISDGFADSEIATVEIGVEIEPLVGLIADWSLDDISSGEVTDMSGNGFHGTLVNATAVSGVEAGAADFNGTDANASLPAEAFVHVSSEISIALWMFGDASQPNADALFQAVDGNGYRVVNIHLPWSNSKVIWDAGNDGGTNFDRIIKDAVAAEFKERWNHWVFTKSVISGEMKVYLNSTLWHSSDVEGSMTRSMSGITAAFLGSSAGGSHYNGIIDEVRLYNTELTPLEVTDLYEAYESYESWTSRYPSLEIESLEHDADGDEDGIEVLMEYVLNGNPSEPDQFILPTLDASGDHFVFTFSRRAESAEDTTQIFEYSSDLIDWYELNITGVQASEVSIDDEIDGTEEVTVTVDKDLAEGGQLFGRLKAIAE